MRIFIITLHTIENEFDDCCRSINALNELPGVEIEHQVFHNLSKREAHDKIYETFMENSLKFDLFMKIDADMVIEDNGIIPMVIRKFQDDEDLDWVTVPVFDYFVMRELGGVNIYRNTVKWEKNVGHFFTDRSHLDHSIRKREILPTEGKLYLSHCRNPSDFQSFHFGFHRMAKALQKGQPEVILRKRNWNAIIMALDLFKREGASRYGWAVLGADVALTKSYSADAVSYTEKWLEHQFDGLCKDVVSQEKFRRRVTTSVFSRIPKFPRGFEYYLIFYYFRVLGGGRAKDSQAN